MPTLPFQIILNICPPKNENFQINNSDMFHISAQNIFLSRNKNNNVYPCKPQFYYIKVGFKWGWGLGGGAKLYRHVFVMTNRYAKNMSSSLAYVAPCPYMSEQHRFLRDFADAQVCLNLCCWHMLMVLFPGAAKK